MFEALKALLGIENPAEEAWPCRPLVVVDHYNDIIWAGDAMIDYKPEGDRFEGGVGTATRLDTGEHIVTFRLVRVGHRDTFGVPEFFPLLNEATSHAETLNATNLDGQALTLFINAHAKSYITAHPSPDAAAGGAVG